MTAPRHVPVLLAEAMAGLAARAEGRYIDGTFGAGGYSRALLAVPGTRVLAIDRDPDAVASADELEAASHGRFRFVPGRFGELDMIARREGFAPVDGVVLDIGISSMQIDDAARGFSFRFDAPLDMRMERVGPSAADILAEADESTIADILFHYGEERRSRAIARAIVAERARSPVATTRALADLCARFEAVRPDRIHPATRAFQALRIAVNDELGELARALAAAESVLREGGRLAAVTFHSLEDRIVKRFLAERSDRGRAASRLLPGETPAEPASFRLVTSKPIEPSAAEVAANPRARSAKLRVAERTDAPARAADVAALLPILPRTFVKERR